MESVNVVDLAIEISSINIILNVDINKINDLSLKFDRLDLSDKDFNKLYRLLGDDIDWRYEKLSSAVRSFQAMVEIIRFNGGR